MRRAQKPNRHWLSTQTKIDLKSITVLRSWLLLLLWFLRIFDSRSPLGFSLANIYYPFAVNSKKKKERTAATTAAEKKLCSIYACVVYIIFIWNEILFSPFILPSFVHISLGSFSSSFTFLSSLSKRAVAASFLVPVETGERCDAFHFLLLFSI